MTVSGRGLEEEGEFGTVAVIRCLASPAGHGVGWGELVRRAVAASPSRNGEGFISRTKHASLSIIYNRRRFQVFIDSFV